MAMVRGKDMMASVMNMRIEDADDDDDNNSGHDDDHGHENDDGG